MPSWTYRLMAAISGISASRQRRGDLAPSDWDALMAAKIEAGIVENQDGSRSVLAEYGGKEYALVAEIVEGVLTPAGFQFVRADRGQVDGGIRGGSGGPGIGREGHGPAIPTTDTTDAARVALERINVGRN